MSRPREYQQLIFSWYPLVLDWETNEIQALFLGFYKYIFMVESKSLYSSFLYIFPIHTNRFRWKTWFFDGMGKSLFMTPFVEWCHEDYLFFLVDISDIHTVSNHSILKYEALPYHGRSLRALSDYLLLYFPSNENKSMFSLAFKIQEFRWYFRHAGRNNYEFYLVTPRKIGAYWTS